MTKGFLTIAQNGKNDYVKMAYVLAMSLKLSQIKYDKLSVIINNNSDIPEKYMKVFDKVLFVEDVKDEWKIQNKWKYFWLTPYDETIVLDADMLFFNDISIWWKLLEKSELEFTTSIRNYRGDITTYDYYRKAFVVNHLPNFYTGLFYFKKTKGVEEYFKLVERIFKNWKDFYGILKNPPKFLSGDFAYSLAAKIWYSDKNWSNFLSFIHMRSRLQDDKIFSDWNKELPAFFTNYNGKLGLKVSNFYQNYPFHYIKKDFLNSEVIELYEETLRLF